MEQYLEDACEQIDAAVFSGDSLYYGTNLEELKDYIGRWTRAIKEHEELEEKYEK